MKSAMTVAAGVVIAALCSPAFAQQGKNMGQCADEMASINKDKTISAAERRKVRSAAFDSLDSDKNGTVSRTEYVDCLVQTPAFKETSKGGAKAVKN